MEQGELLLYTNYETHIYRIDGRVFMQKEKDQNNNDFESNVAYIIREKCCTSC